MGIRLRLEGPSRQCLEPAPAALVCRGALLGRGALVAVLRERGQTDAGCGEQHALCRWCWVGSTKPLPFLPRSSPSLGSPAHPPFPCHPPTATALSSQVCVSRSSSLVSPLLCPHLWFCFPEGSGTAVNSHGLPESNPSAQGPWASPQPPWMGGQGRPPDCPEGEMCHSPTQDVVMFLPPAPASVPTPEPLRHQIHQSGNTGPQRRHSPREGWKLVPLGR